MTNGQTAVAVTKPQEVAVDFGQIFVRREGGEILNPFWAKVTLEESRGHINWIKGKFSISGAGYVHLNKVASISLVTPQTIVVDGVAKPNPNVERNPVTKAIETVNVRKIGIGYSAVGNIVVIDKSLYYNAYTYLLQSFQAKMKKGEKREPQQQPAQAAQPPVTPCAFIGVLADKPKEGKWTWFVMTEPLGIWVDYEHPAIIDCLEEHVQRQRFGDRIAQKIVERNILKDHPAIGVSQVQIELPTQKDFAKAIVKVVGWQHSMAAEQVTEISVRAEKGERISGEASQQDIVDADLEEEKATIAEEAEAEEKPLSKGRRGEGDGKTAGPSK